MLGLSIGIVVRVRVRVRARVRVFYLSNALNNKNFQFEPHDQNTNNYVDQHQQYYHDETNNNNNNNKKSISSYWWPSPSTDGGILGKIYALQNPDDCSSPNTKYLVLQSMARNEEDTRGLTAWVRMF